MMLELVPDEVKQCPQWLLWKPTWLADKNKWTKVPLSARTGQKASVRAPHEWSDFATCASVYTQYSVTAGLGGLGFVFGYASGIAGLDNDNVFDGAGNVLDHNAVEVARRFNSYTEVSPSGTGLHTLFKANVPDGRRSKVGELYGEGRYFTMTGIPYFNLPLAERQSTADAFREYIDAERARATSVAVDWSVQPKYTPEQIWAMASTAANGQKFFDLFHGNWHGYGYPSQSEADFALIDILAFYSDSPVQIQQMFYASRLNDRNKDAERKGKYVQAMIERAFDRKVPLVAIPAMPVQIIAEPVQPQQQAPEHVTEEEAEEAAERADDPFTIPPGGGMVGRVAEFIFQQSPYPMREASLMAALALFAGICGRQYQFNDKGLNLYLMLLANTGSGKEAMSTGIGKIMEAVCDPPKDVNAQPTKDLSEAGFPSARAFRGPAMVTGKGLMTTLAKCDPLSMFSILNEFADTMRQMADPRNSNQGLAQLRTALLDLYMKSSEGNSYAGNVTADKDTTIKAISSPAFTFLAECTPGKLYSYLTEDLIESGLLPRMVIFESHGFGEYNPHFGKVKVPHDIVQHMKAQAWTVINMKVEGDRRVYVQFADQAAADRSEAFRVYARKRLLSPNNTDGTRNLWNRAHLNVERIAALVAIGCDPREPKVTVAQIDWAARIITRQIILLVGKFRRGETGEILVEDGKQQDELVKLVKSFAKLDPANMPKSYSDKACVDARMAGCVPFRFLSQRVTSIPFFARDRRGAGNALRAAIDTAIKSGTLEPARLEGHSATFYKIKL